MADFVASLRPYFAPQGNLLVRDESCDFFKKLNR